MSTPPTSSPNMSQLAIDIKRWGQDLGFQQIGITNTDLSNAETHLNRWLTENYHGDMSYMVKHGNKRARPNELIPGTLRVISVRMSYYPESSMVPAIELLDSPNQAYISRYALGRDYHKVLRKRLAKLIKHIQETLAEHNFRAFVDSAPVLEKALAEKAGLGWIGKHTNVINKRAGSWFFLGEIYTDLALPIDSSADNHCGSCTSCIDVCPTQAIIAPYKLDARRCISYLTIELKTAIPVELRPLMGNRIYGCDDCQLFCPWNKFNQATAEDDFTPRHALDHAKLIELFLWDEAHFLSKTEGTPIRRISHNQWLRNIAVALGNAPYHRNIIAALNTQKNSQSELVKEHVAWALAQHASRTS